MFIDELFLRDSWNIFVVIFPTWEYILGKTTSIKITAQFDSNSPIWNLRIALSLVKRLWPSLKKSWPFVYSLETQFINHTILLSADAIYVSLNSSLTQMLNEFSCSLSDFKSHFECYSFVVAFVIGESHLPKTFFSWRVNHKTRIKRNANDVFFMINKHPCHQFDCSKVFIHPFRTDWGQISSVGIFYPSDLSIFKVIYGICLHFEVSLWIVWWRISISFPWHFAGCRWVSFRFAIVRRDEFSIID